MTGPTAVAATPASPLAFPTQPQLTLSAATVLSGAAPSLRLVRMEAAATPLRNPRVTALLGRVIIEHLVVDDALAAELVRSRTDAGENPDRTISDAIEIGARV